MDVKRRLSAIMAADVVGYSRMMGRDEDGTLRRVRELFRDVVRPLAASHRGRVVKTMGDGFLCEFASVIHAFQCAVKLQLTAGERNEGVDADSKLVLRIGINIGDIIFEQGDVFGEGVNIAARLEGLARPGGICVSARAYEDLRKLDLPFQDLGDIELKNIARPIRAYAIHPAGTEAAAGAEATPKPAPREPPPVSVPQASAPQASAPQASPAPAAARRGNRWRVAAAVLGGALVLGVAAAAMMSRPRISPREYVAARIERMPCSWLRVSDHSSVDGVQVFELSGASITPPAQIARSLLDGAKAQRARVDRVITTDVAPLYASQCGWLDRLKARRYTGVPRYRLQVTPRSDGWTQAVLTLDPDDLGSGGAVYGIEPSGRVERIVDAKDLADAPGVTRHADGSASLSLMIDHVGWSGVVLMESARPAPDGLVEAAATGPDGQFDGLARAGGWRFELAWFRVGP